MERKQTISSYLVSSSPVLPLFQLIFHSAAKLKPVETMSTEDSEDEGDAFNECQKPFILYLRLLHQLHHELIISRVGKK
jgi:hypothetical protein